MPEELEIHRINIILPEDWEEIMTLAPKDVDTSKKDKVKKWVERSFKNLERLKLNLGGELDAEGFFGLEEQGDHHADKVLLCVYSKDKIKLTSFVAALGHISFRPSTSKKGRLPFLGKWLKDIDWRSKITMYGGLFKHTEMVRVRKIRKKDSFEDTKKIRHQSQPVINFNMLKYYKPYIVDRHAKSKPTLKSTKESTFEIVNEIEPINVKKKLHRSIKNNDFTNPPIHSLFKIDPKKSSNTINLNKLNVHLDDSFLNVDRRIVNVYDVKDVYETKKKRRERERFIERNPEPLVQTFPHHSIMSNLWFENKKTLRTERKDSPENLSLSTKISNLFEDKSNDNYKIKPDLNQFNGITERSVEVFKKRDNHKCSCVHLNTVKASKSIGVQAGGVNEEADIKPSTTRNMGVCCKEEEIDKMFNIKSYCGSMSKRKLKSFVTIKGDVGNETRQEGSLRSRRKKERKKRNFNCCFRCLRRKKGKISTSTSTKTYVRSVSPSLKTFSFDQQPLIYNPSKVKRSHLKHGKSEDKRKKGIFRKFFTKRKIRSSLKQYESVYSEMNRHYEVSDAEIIALKFPDNQNNKMYHFVKPWTDYSDDISEIITFHGDIINKRCNSPRKRSLHRSQTTDSLEYARVKQKSYLKMAKAKRNQSYMLENDCRQNFDLSHLELSEMIHRKNRFLNKLYKKPYYDESKLSLIRNSSSIEIIRDPLDRKIYSTNTMEQRNIIFAKYRPNLDTIASAQSTNIFDLVHNATVAKQWPYSSDSVSNECNYKINIFGAKNRANSNATNSKVKVSNNTLRTNFNIHGNEIEYDFTLGKKQLSDSVNIVEIKTADLKLENILKKLDSSLEYGSLNSVNNQFQNSDQSFPFLDKTGKTIEAANQLNLNSEEVTHTIKSSNDAISGRTKLETLNKAFHNPLLIKESVDLLESESNDPIESCNYSVEDSRNIIENVTISDSGKGDNSEKFSLNDKTLVRDEGKLALIDKFTGSKSKSQDKKKVQSNTLKQIQSWSSEEQQLTVKRNKRLSSA